MSARAGRLLWATVFVTYLLIVLGGVVRLSGASLACPDWPLCHGRLIPPPDPLVWIEWVHRLIAGAVGVLVLGLWAWSELTARREARLRRWLRLAVFLLLAQAGLGALVVVLERPAWVAMGHLVTSQLFFASVILAALRAEPGWRRDVPHPARRWAAWSLVALLAVILAGGWVTNSLAAAACGDWPLCQGELLPSSHPLVLIHLLHRLVVVLAGVLLFVLWRRTRTALTATLLHLYGLQVLLGGAYILLDYPLWAASLHLAVAAALWGLAVALWARLRPEPARLRGARELRPTQA